MKKYIQKNWKDIGAFFSIALLTTLSFLQGYHLGMLIGFLLILLFFSYDRIKRIIIELNIKRIFGVEFGDIDRDTLKESIRQSLQEKGKSVANEDLDVIANAALHRIEGVAYKGRYYEEMIKYSLDDLMRDYQRHVQTVVDKQPICVDFLVEIGATSVVGIEAIYSDHRFVPTERLLRVRERASALRSADNLIGFVIVTNSQVSDSDKALLKESTVPIDVIEKTVSPDALLLRLKTYLSKFDAA